MNTLKTLFIILLFTGSLNAYAQQRARDLGIPFDGKPGTNNAITDVAGVLVGYKTKISGKGKMPAGKGAVRTGVTVILPKGKSIDPVPAGWFCLNGDGEMTGTTVIDEYGLMYGALGITNTNSVGVVRDAIGEWNVKNFSKGDLADFSFGLPVVAETFDGILNDINGFHVKREDVFDALDSAHSGPIAEGNVGGGTGMSLFLFKGGSGTASRIIEIDTAKYTVGAFVQGNFGGRKDLMISGVPVGKEISEAKPIITSKDKDGSIIVVIATDAPLLPMQLRQIAKRATIGVARTGGMGRNSSGDIFIAFSTAAPKTNEKGTMETWKAIPKEQMDKLYQATAESVEEAIINALVAAKTMEGFNGNTIFEIPKDRLKEVMKKYNRYSGTD
ncbi:MAG: S58 family peptidase [Flavobacterium sp.]|nr:MAG: S58 family peptidase [Flavobacterium sp.]